MTVQGQKIENSEKTNKQNMMSAVPFMELSATGTLTGIENINGTDTYVIDYGSGVMGYYDTKTGLKVREAVETNVMGQESTANTDYADYKEVSGVKIPHKVTVYLGPQALDFTVSKVVINEGVTAEDFK